MRLHLIYEMVPCQEDLRIVRGSRIFQTPVEGDRAKNEPSLRWSRTNQEVEKEMTDMSTSKNRRIVVGTDPQGR